MTARAHTARIALLLATALLATSCSGTSEDKSEPDKEQSASQEALTLALTDAGVRILDEDGGTLEPAAEPPSGLTLTLDQASSLADQAESQTGHLGADLDALGDPQDIPMSALLAAYARGVDTPGARTARELLGEQDLTYPQAVVFPSLVLTLFASDAAQAMGGTTDLSLSSAGTGDKPGALCSRITGAIYDGVNAVFNALHVQYVDVPKTGILFLDGIIQGLANLVVDGINFVVEAGRKLIIGILEYTIGKVLSIIGKIAALAAMITQFAMLLSPMEVSIETNPPGEVPKGIAPDLVKVKATVKAQVRIFGTGSSEWPDEVVDCAKVAGVDLPPLRPIGDPVEWEIHNPASEPGLLVEDPNGKKEPVLRAGDNVRTAVADLPMVTATETEAKGEKVYSTAFVRAKVSRRKIEELRDLVLDMGVRLITDELPPAIGNYLHDVIVGEGKELSQDLATTVFSATGVRAVDVSFHQPEKDKPKSGKTTREVWQGTWASNAYEISGSFTWTLVRNGNETSGSLEVSGSDCIQGGQIQARIDGRSVEFGLVKGGRALISFSGTINGATMSGTYVSGADCGSDQGSWRASR